MKYYQASFLIKMVRNSKPIRRKLENNHKYVETEQHATRKTKEVHEEIKEEIRKHLKTNENQHTVLQKSKIQQK